MNSDRRAFMRRIGTGAIGGLTLSPGCMGFIGNSGPVEETGVVRLTSEGDFDPKNAKVEMNQRAELTFENEDDVEHRVVSPSETIFIDKTIPSGQAALASVISEGVFEVFMDWDNENTPAEEFDGKRMKIAIGSGEIEDPIE